eukprot:CAMPEP_0174371292 /NCGR_PEP_ID=MMETSP0811_2-20130205/99280_1 /TAXON_ID=73025 ORGANISM="Eutreptiella gymnastica-like, Strain CCMP1594" /NCGR_SAMPLE_ID=MMETSP0811_2 /ASSEMBLY_ACC=CAM_ASM_000667 /LENGTH=69 /DNA_ID=CAMNT_0015517559 /DNA_START=113 /DNA_END=322 /DNA_ORIENTATION=+
MMMMMTMAMKPTMRTGKPFNTLEHTRDGSSREDKRGVMPPTGGEGAQGSKRVALLGHAWVRGHNPSAWR